MKSCFISVYFSRFAVIQVSIAAVHSVKGGNRLSHDSFITKIKLCVISASEVTTLWLYTNLFIVIIISVGVHLEAIALNYSDDVGGVLNKVQRSKDASLWYATKNR